MGVNMCYLTNLADSQEKLTSFVQKRVFNTSDAEDVLQNTNEVLIKKQNKFKGDPDNSEEFLKWAFGICRMQLMAFLKKRKRNKEVLYEDKVIDDFLSIDSHLNDFHQINPDWLSDVPFASLIKKEREELIKNLNCLLSPRQKQVFNMLVDGLSTQEISEVMGVSKISVQVLKSRLIRRIRNFIESDKEKYNNCST